jgi:hypothetical protein
LISGIRSSHSTPSPWSWPAGPLCAGMPEALARTSFVPH